MTLLTLAILSAAFAYWKPLRRKIATILFDVFIFMASLYFPFQIKKKKI